MPDTNFKILIVDDDPQFRKTLADVLERSGYGTTAVGTPEEAVRAAEEATPNVAIIDLKLENASGLEVMRQIKDISPYTECIILTGYASQESAIEAVNVGAYSYVQKPYDLDQLLVNIRRASERSEAGRALQESEHKYRALVEHSLQGMVLAQGVPPRLVFANAALADILGYTVEELLALPPEETVILVHPEDRGFFFSRYRDRLEGKPTIPGYEVRGIRKDGTTCWLELHASQINYGGEPAVQTVFVDITERKQAEEQLKESYEQVRKSLWDTVNALAAAVEKRDPYTAGHQKEVANLAATVATQMGLSPDQISGIRMAGLIHDIGKIYIPAEILSKPTELNEIEQMMIRTHPEAGYDVLSAVDFPWPVAETVLQHHERMDGSGYPRGLTGEDISLEARILAVADVVEAMASHRPYRPARPREKVLHEIEQKRGVLYDPDAADAILKLLIEDGHDVDSG